MRPKENDKKRIARLHVDIYMSKNDLSDDKKSEAITSLEKLMKDKPYVYAAAKAFQLPLPDLQTISEEEYDELLNWASNDCEHDPSLDDIAAQYKLIRARNNNDPKVMGDTKRQKISEKMPSISPNIGLSRTTTIRPNRSAADSIGANTNEVASPLCRATTIGKYGSGY